jgi:sulfur dioxygenase
MLFRQLFDKTSSTYTYLLASGPEAVLIDPVLEHVPLYLQLLQELQLTLHTSLETHVHADHITGASALRAATGCQLGIGEKASIDCADIKLKSGERLHIGGLELTPLYTPGHTDDSYCFLLPDRVFTGDTLLIRGTGRTDFQNGSAVSAYHSLFSVLLTLPDETLVYPAHDYRGMTVSTIGEEKRANPRLQVNSEAEYVALMDALNLPKPALIEQAVPANRRCGASSD